MGGGEEGQGVIMGRQGPKDGLKATHWTGGRARGQYGCDDQVPRTHNCSEQHSKPNKPDTKENTKFK